ncbi:Zn(2)-C6 fungal-type domain-containing protein [Fusarium keratoplasticum]|uniref:Zn(2)-C6 fungal-type domain-containing protein n=1 Tax=Fusarium keratoplasticum TaxID=1328300 RepID=A0ACC0REH3_9HYPO|nr:Zn(2)-C6 fungal-type domain-containing protein [Fusarium keratoplasticum]KAI8680422.1 Zn(2)-C6 fungal-type domain-containing protein [Fusarium keratoplasticum]
MAPPTSKTTLDSPDSGAPRKRRRTALACEECRDRKRKCDGVKPERNSKGWWSNNYVQELKSRVRELEDTQRLAGTINVHIPPSEGELGGPVVLPEGSPVVVPPAQDDSDDHNDSPDERPQLDTDHGLRVPEDDAPDGADAMGSYHLGIPSPLESTAVAPIDNASEQTSAPWANLSFGPLSAFVSPPKDHPEKGIEKPAMADTGAEQPAMDAMGVVVSIHGANPQSSKHPSDYFGPSSTISLLREARSVMGRRNCGHVPWLLGNCSTGKDGTMVSTSEPSPMSSIWLNSGYDKFHPMLGMNVPPRTDADRLVNLFWTYVHSLYPFLHWPSFYDRYLTLWTPQTSPQENRATCSMNGYYSTLNESLFHCMLNVVFALGVLHNTELTQQERDDISYTFFRRAKSLLGLDLLESGSTPLVQVLLLMGQYLQTRDITSSCWNIIGMAIRVAQGIGLHLQPEEREEGDASNCQAADQLEEEMRRRAWTGCVLLDRILSLTYGRPLMIHSGAAHSRLSLPSTIDDELLTRFPHSPGSQPSDMPSRVECYIHAIKLQDILGQVLTSFYHQGSENEGASTSSLGVDESQRKGISNAGLQKLLDLDGELDAWNRNLPAHLQVDSYSIENSSLGGPRSKRSTIFCRQATVLKARFLYVRLILLRPSLSELCDSKDMVPARLGTANASMRQSMLIKTGNLCASVAQELVHLITENSRSRAHLLPPPWYNVLYIHGCALVLLLSSLCLSKYNDVDQPSLMTDWNRCLTFLREYQVQSRSASRCIRILELLEQEASSYNSGNRMMDEPHTSSLEGHQPTLSVDARHLGLDLITGKDVPSTLALGLGEEDSNWVNTDGLDWFSLAPFFDGTADIAP